MLAGSPGNKTEGFSPAAKLAIGEQLNRMVASTYFSHSKRLPNFLRFVVEHTLAGDVENIKERTLGIEIFGREPNYDTSADPIVRVTAAELRKRMAQYYQEHARNQELRISLPSGSYIPEFRGGINSADLGLPELDPQPTPVALPTLVPTPVADQPAVADRPATYRLAMIALMILGLLGLAAGGAFFAWQRMHRSAFDEFWQPIFSGSDPVLLCIADQMEYSEIALRDAAQPEHQIILKDTLTAVVLDDLAATVKVASILEANNKLYSLKGEGSTTLASLRAGPTVFVGAYDNAWTLRLTDSLRYHFANDADMTHLWIVDGAAPGRSGWSVDRGVQMATNNYRDYAILARFTDVNTGKPAVVVAGIGRGGTRVAGEFLTDNADLAQLMRLAHAAGDKKNLEVVLSTQIIDGEPGSPKIEATYFW
jgi:hypothetical protein